MKELREKIEEIRITTEIVRESPRIVKQMPLPKEVVDQLEALFRTEMLRAIREANPKIEPHLPKGMEPNVDEQVWNRACNRYEQALIERVEGK